MSAEKKDRFSCLIPGEPIWPEDYGLTPGHCLDVLQGSYDIPWWPESPPTILDIGANVGAFTRWASYRWPNCSIHAYEPEPNNFKLLRRTVKELPGSCGVYLNECAVADGKGRVTLANYGYNCGEFTICQPVTDRPPVGAVEVEVRAAHDLPSAHIIKIDAEGAERAIIEDLVASGKINATSAIMFEYHADTVGEALKQLLIANGFSLVGEHRIGDNRGEHQFMRTQLLEQLYPS